MVFVVCASLEKECLVAAVTANLERFARLYVGEKRVVILQIDEMATEPRARYYGRTDEVRISNFETSLLCCARDFHSSTENREVSQVKSSPHMQYDSGDVPNKSYLDPKVTLFPTSHPVVSLHCLKSDFGVVRAAHSRDEHQVW